MPKQGKEGGVFRKEKRNTPTEQEAKSTTLTKKNKRYLLFPLQECTLCSIKPLAEPGGKPVVLASISLQYCSGDLGCWNGEEEEEEEKGDPSPPLPKQQENIERQKKHNGLAWAAPTMVKKKPKKRQATAPYRTVQSWSLTNKQGARKQSIFF